MWAYWFNVVFCSACLVFQIYIHVNRPWRFSAVLVAFQAVLTALVIAVLVIKLRTPVPGVEG